jgi:hypothetical protein
MNTNYKKAFSAFLVFWMGIMVGWNWQILYPLPNPDFAHWSKIAISSCFALFNIIYCLGEE